MSLSTDKLKPFTQSRVNCPALVFSESMPTWRLESEKHKTLKARFCLQSNSSIKVDLAAQTSSKNGISLKHLQFLIELKALDGCIFAVCMFKQQSQEQDMKSRSHTSAVVSSWIFIWSLERKRAVGERQSLRELLGFMCFTGGGGYQDGTEHRLGYSMGHMDAIHCTHSSLKQSISLNDFGLTG